MIFGFIAMFAGPKGRGVPFVPSSKKNVETMVRLSGAKSGETVADLGSGDGRIVIAFARAGIEAHGYELNPVLVFWARLRILFSGLGGKAHIHLGNYWKEDYARFNIVTVFGLPPMMGELEKKLKRELKPGSRVFSNGFHFPTWERVQKENGISMYRA